MSICKPTCASLYLVNPPLPCDCGASSTEPVTPTVTRADFLRDAAGVMRRSETEGPIVVLGDDGKPSCIVHHPTDVRPEFGREEPVAAETPDGGKPGYRSHQCRDGYHGVCCTPWCTCKCHERFPLAFPAASAGSPISDEEALQVAEEGRQMKAEIAPRLARLASAASHLPLTMPTCLRCMRLVASGGTVVGDRAVCADCVTPKVSSPPPASPEVARLREALARLVMRTGEPEGVARDWACRECRPNSDTLVDGFLCAWHAARALVSTIGVTR